MAIWLRAREEFADNRFQLLFIYIDRATVQTCGQLQLIPVQFVPICICFLLHYKCTLVHLTAAI